MILTVDPLNPARMRLDDVQDESAVAAFLKFRSRSAEFTWRKFKNNRWYADRHGAAAFQEELQRLKDEIQQSVLWEENGVSYTYTGLADHIENRFKGTKLINNIVYPEPSSLPWKFPPKQTVRSYQKEAVDRLIEVRHGAVEVATGLGKTRMILDLVRRLGLKTVIMAPSVSIADNLYGVLSSHLGIKYVGFLGDGRKQLGKLITIGIFASLAKVEKGSEVYEDLSSAQCFIVDESHMTPASTLEKVCLGVCSSAPYRFFFSATQMRGDGAELVLKGITGPIVLDMTFQEGVDQNYLARPTFRMIHVSSPSSKFSRDANETTRHHLYYNPIVNKRAADLANLAVSRLNHSVLILVQEVEQFAQLLPHLRHEVRFAHGGVTKDNRDKVPQAYWESDVSEIVKDFNEQKFPILIGTSCIGTGTDILPAKTVIYLMGQSSEVKVKQAVGRGTRRTDDKDSFHFIDFDVEIPNQPDSPVHRHAQIRESYYRDLYPEGIAS